MKLKAIISADGKISSNPDIVAELSTEEISSVLNNLEINTIMFSSWKKVDVVFRKGNEEVVKKKTKIVSTEKSKTDFASLFLEQFEDFKEHVMKSKKSIL